MNIAPKDPQGSAWSRTPRTTGSTNASNLAHEGVIDAEKISRRLAIQALKDYNRKNLPMISPRGAKASPRGGGASPRGGGAITPRATPRPHLYKQAQRTPMSTYQKACKDLGFKPRSEAAMAEMGIYVHGAFSGNVLAKGGEGLDPNKPKEEKVYGGTLSARGRGLHGADWDNTQGDHHVLGYDKNHETKKQIQALRAKVQLEHEKRLTTASELRDRRALEAKRSKRAPAVPGMISPRAMRLAGQEAARLTAAARVAGDWFADEYSFVEAKR